MESPDKQELRRSLSQARPQNSQGLTEQLLRLVRETEASTIASYSPMDAEPDVRNFNAQVQEIAQLLLPRIIGEDLEFASGPLSPGPFGILQPEGVTVPLQTIDLMIVPALAVDSAGNRLGKGRGFYDRVLERYHGASVAVVFDSEVLESVPHEPHDQKISAIVTPSRTIVVG